MKISVIMPSFNYDSYLSEAIESVLAQSFQDWELLIVDDGSADKSPQIIESYVSQYPEKIRYFYHENRQNRGLAKTYELGFKHSRGEYIALLEADDAWLPESLALRLEILEKDPKIAVAYSGVEMVGERKVIQKIVGDFQQWKLPYELITDRSFYAFPLLLDNNPLLTCSAIMTRRSFIEGLDLSAPYDAWFDWWLLVQLSVEGKFHYITRPSIRWRLHEKSYINRFNGQLDLYKASCSFLDDIYYYLVKYSKEHPLNQEDELSTALHAEVRKRKKQRPFVLLDRIVKTPIKKILSGIEVHGKKLLKMIIGGTFYQKLKSRWHFKQKSGDRSAKGISLPPEMEAHSQFEFEEQPTHAKR